MPNIYKADLSISAPRHLRGIERLRALRHRRYRTLAELCDCAAIVLRVSGGVTPLVALWDGPGHAYTVSDALRRVYLVDRHALPQHRTERAFRILEILAFGFNDYFARETLCGRGYFVADVTPEHGRAWLREIGRTGGRARSTRKSAASRENGCHSKEVPSRMMLDGRSEA